MLVPNNHLSLVPCTDLIPVGKTYIHRGDISCASRQEWANTFDRDFIYRTILCIGYKIPVRFICTLTNIISVPGFRVPLHCYPVIGSLYPGLQSVTVKPSFEKLELYEGF